MKTKQHREKLKSKQRKKASVANALLYGVCNCKTKQTRTKAQSKTKTKAKEA